MILGIRPKGTSVHLSFGTWLHSALEVYDKAKALGATYDHAVQDAVIRALRDSVGFAPYLKTKKTVLLPV